MRFLIIFLFRAKAQRSKGAKEEINLSCGLNM